MENNKTSAPRNNMGLPEQDEQDNQLFTDEMLDGLYAFEAWELPYGEVDFTLCLVDGNEHYTLTKQDAENLVERIFRKYPHWLHSTGGGNKSMTE